VDGARTGLFPQQKCSPRAEHHSKLHITDDAQCVHVSLPSLDRSMMKRDYSAQVHE